MEPLLKFLAFSENEPLPYRPNFLRNEELGVRTRYGYEIRIILKLRTCTFTGTTLGSSINDFSFFGERPLTLSPKVSLKWITRSRNTLRR